MQISYLGDLRTGIPMPSLMYHFPMYSHNFMRAFGTVNFLCLAGVLFCGFVRSEFGWLVGD